MPALRPGGLQRLLIPPHSRSRGGSIAGFSDRPGRRNPRTASSVHPGGRHQTTLGKGPASTSEELPPEFIRAVKRLLERQRGFRIGQLDELVAAPAEANSDVARNEVRVRLRTAVRTALADIDDALRRIEQGGYGHCHSCDAPLSHARLAALPMARLCSSCQRALDDSTRDPRPLRAGECTMVRTSR